MTSIEQIKEKLALHGYNDWEEVNVVEDGLVHFSRKGEGKDRLCIQVRSAQQMGEPFWLFSLNKFIHLFSDNRYLGAGMRVEVENITEEQLKYLSVFETRLNGVDTSLVDGKFPKVATLE